MVTRRIKIAELIENAINRKDWKGEEEACGIWFADERGYVLNRVMAIEIKHIERAPDVFYSFCASTEEKVTLHYPFNNMKITPKKQHILHEQVKPDDLAKVFELDNSLAQGNFQPAALIQFIMTSIKDKRSRDRAICFWDTTTDRWTLKKMHSNVEKQILYGEQTIETVWKEEKKIQLIKVSASTFLSVLSIFDQNRHIEFFVSRDRMKLTSKTPTGNEVNIVIALMK